MNLLVYRESKWPLKLWFYRKWKKGDEMEREREKKRENEIRFSLLFGVGCNEKSKFKKNIKK